MAIADGALVDWAAIEAAGVLPASEVRALRELAALRAAPGGAFGLVPGKVVGDFRLIALVGEGGMGQVWEVEQLSLARRVALKFIRPERVTEHLLELFAREARAGGRMNHPGIVTIHGHGRSDGLAWIAMELVSGARNLRAALDAVVRAGAVPPEHDRRVARYVAEVAEAMHAAHAAGVIHRDLKPQNVLITPEDRVKVTDFGVARIADEQLLSRSGEPAGTYLYMSPEQLAGPRRELDHRTDVFSLGVVLYELTALRRPFAGDTSHQVAQQILEVDPPDPRTVRSRVPRDLAVIIGKALEKERAKRFQSMAEFAADLRRFLAGEPIRARPPSAARRCVQWMRRHPARTVATTIGSVALVAITALLLANLRANRDLRDTNEALRVKTGEAEKSAAVATARADDVLRLSALQHLEDLLARADALWPPHPERIDAYEDWLRDARALVQDLPLHRTKRAELRAKAAPPGDAGGEWIFPEAEREARWWNNQLSKLIAGLEELERGLLGEDGATPEHGWSVPRRLRFARGLADSFASGGAHARAWADALPAIRARYPGLELTPQLGLVPLGPDPASGLWEFAHLATGEPPVRGADGRLVPTDATGLVLVLVPGGTFRMGAQDVDPDGPNYDPSAQDDESPVHEVTISPFFLSKYEMNQAQWVRMSGHNPSVYTAMGSTDALVPVPTHPVEQVSWFDCMRMCARMGLVLPSEAQWEYAARAGTTTIWWTGNERESLRGAVNLADQSAARADASWPDIKDWPDLDDGFVAHAPVDLYRPNPFGLHNVCGNVNEWCLDANDGMKYLPEPARDPVKDPAKGPLREHRGGCWYNAAVAARSANRGHSAPEYKASELGLRPARVVTR